MAFCTCDFIADQLIASYQEIFLLIPVKDKLATPALYYLDSSIQSGTF